eukprot:CAMPEP_0202450642 /NCGR_PEP_ID=MMETSP1360-20130828/9229_1 /ASSEMBLY_ACC=CAM_ASM_000848 /TAXON_ID=515479 /ORGANISM="Licmophora paradoxa, Strain CCMP2313" /LENGTH=322 /DNA_ID=CAMNT_0049068991 /DNA_START=32 /DNA_END=1000 /DNA_ORIENTATION=-
MSCKRERVRLEASSDLSLLQMLNEEEMLYCKPDHRLLKKKAVSVQPSLVWREKVSQWFYDVIDHLEESRDCVYLAMNVLDRFVLYEKEVTERRYEAVAMTALFISVQVWGNKSLDVVDLVNMSRLGITLEEIATIGKELTNVLSWENRLRTPKEFIASMVHFFPLEISDTAQESAVFIAQLSVCDPFFSKVKASDVALASLLNSVHELSSGTMALLNARLKLKAYPMNELEALCLRLKLLVRHTTNQDAVPHIIPNDDGSDLSTLRVENALTIRRCPARVVSKEKIAFNSCPSTAAIDDREPTHKRVISPCPADRPTKRSRA